MKKYLLSFFILLTAMTEGLAAETSVTEFSYSNGIYEQFGTGKAETYDVAIRIADESLAGLKITKIAVPLQADDSISNVSIWLTNELTTVKIDNVNVNQPDIMQVEANLTDGMAEAVLSEPYTLTENGVYVGYSFDVTGLSDYGKAPVVVSKGTNPDGFYMHTSRTYRKWRNMFSKNSDVSAMTVTLEGDFGEYSVAINSIESPRVMAGEDFLLPVEIANQGSADVTSLTYSYGINDSDAITATYELPEPLEAKFNSMTVAKLPIDGIEMKGNVNIHLEITGINGNPNANGHASADALIRLLSFVPVHRPVMEEYTGTWCGYCVRGIAAMEHMNAKYPDTYIGIAYHSGDPMAVFESFPNSYDGLPASYLDRAIFTDPYYGTYTSGFGIEQDWLDRCDVIAPASIEVDAEWDGENVVATATVNFAEEPEDNFELAYMLIEDDMTGTGSSWRQNNNYKGQRADDFIPEMAQFCEGAAMISGLHFNDVVVMGSNLRGIPGSLENVALEVPQSHSFTFRNVREVKNVYNDAVVQNTGKLRVVAALIDKRTGEIANGAKSEGISGTPAAVGGISSDAAIVNVKYYDMCGNEVSRPASGVYVKVISFTDGHSVSVKEILK